MNGSSVHNARLSEGHENKALLKISATGRNFKHVDSKTKCNVMEPK